MKTKILFRADGHHQMGLGHIVRSLALVRMLKMEFECHFAIQNPPKALLPQIQAYCKEVVILPPTDLLVEEAYTLCENHLTGDEIVVLDGYHFNTEYQQTFKNKGCKVVCIDDIYSTHFVADAIINHAGGITEAQYSAEPHTQFYLGLNYILLRQPFLKAAQNRRLPNAQKIAFICLGGADPSNQTLKVLERLQQIDYVKQCYIVIGGAYQHRAVLEKFIAKGRLKVMILQNISAERMINVMRLCAVAITSPSTISLEYLTISGDLYLHQIADNQKDMLQYLTKNELAFSFNQFPVKDKATIIKVRNQQKKVLDGKSSLRLLKVFRKLEQEQHCQIRKATIDDMMTYFHWANDHQTRSQSFSSNPITLTEHKHWFSKKIFSAVSHLYVLDYKGVPVGQIRFDKGDKALLSYSIAPSARGKGFGSYLLKSGIQQFQQDMEEDIEVVGYVKQENIASNRAFLKLGFQQTPAAEQVNTFRYSL